MKTKDKWSRVIVAAGVVWAICTVFAVASNAQTPAAPAGSGVWGGVYTSAQAKRGEGIANRTCGNCHAADLSGGEGGPSLVGPEFFGKWSQRSLGDLFQRTYDTMPTDAPGSLSLQDTADLIARVLQLNDVPAGEKELPTDVNALNQIKIESQPPAK